MEDESVASCEKRQGVFSFAFCLLILAALTVFGLYRSSFGLDLMDEGHYLSNPMRYALGDLPFRDEIQNALRSVDIVMWPLASLFPNLGLYGYRALGVILCMAVMAGMCVFFRKQAPLYLIAPACAASAFLGVGYWVPGYNQFGTTFYFLSIMCWLSACERHPRKNTVLLSLLAVLLFFIGILSYSPLAGTIIVPVFAVALCLVAGKKNSRVVLASLIFIIGIVLLSLAAVGVVHFSGLAGDWLAAHKALSSNQFHDVSLFRRAVILLKKMRILVPHILGVIGLLLGVGIILPKKKSLPGFLTVVALCGVVTWLTYTFVTRTPPHDNFFREIYHEPMLIASAAFGLILTSFLLMLHSGTENVKNLSTTLFRPIMFGFSAIIYFLIQAYVSSNSILNGLYGVGPLFVCGIVLLAYVLEKMNRNEVCGWRTKSLGILLIVFCLTLAALNLRHKMQNVYHDQPCRKLSARFSRPRLKGIYTLPHKVESIEALLNYMDGKVKRGDLLLCYNDCPLLYFLTQTRPAVNCTWTSGLFSREVKKGHIEYMVKNKRIPKYCIRLLEQWPFGNKQSGGGGMISYSENPEIDPLHSFIIKNYRLEKTIHPFEIWVEKVD